MAPRISVAGTADEPRTWWAGYCARLLADRAAPCPSWCDAVAHTEHDTDEHCHGFGNAALILRWQNVDGMRVLEEPFVRLYIGDDEIEMPLEDSGKLSSSDRAIIGITRRRSRGAEVRAAIDLPSTHDLPGYLPNRSR
jgi:hypothetical protein